MPQHVSAELVREVESSFPQPASPDDDMTAVVTAALAELPERERALITLLYMGPDMPTSADLASKLGMSEAGVKVLHYRAMHRLRSLIEAQTMDPLTVARDVIARRAGLLARLAR